PHRRWPCPRFLREEYHPVGRGRGALFSPPALSGKDTSSPQRQQSGRGQATQEAGECFLASRNTPALTRAFPGLPTAEHLPGRDAPPLPTQDTYQQAPPAPEAGVKHQPTAAGEKPECEGGDDGPVHGAEDKTAEIPPPSTTGCGISGSCSTSYLRAPR
ncbi:unnamed protein product, partial [Gulo gulo]